MVLFVGIPNLASLFAADPNGIAKATDTLKTDSLLFLGKINQIPNSQC